MRFGIYLLVALLLVSVSFADTAVNDSYHMTYHRPVLFNLTANDIGSNLTVGSLSTPSHGKVSNNYDGTVTYTPDSGYEGIDTFTYEIINSSFKSFNGHYYEYVPASVNWTTANATANNMTFDGLQGYLTTITSQDENDFVQNRVGTDSWMGASDHSEDKNWTWVTGPEAGLHFFNQRTDNAGTPGCGFGGSAIGDNYSNWASGEPNDADDRLGASFGCAGAEDYAEFYAGSGKWNDFSDLQQLGFIVEYGGMPGDNSTVPSATVTINISSNPNDGINYTGFATCPLTASPLNDSSMIYVQLRDLNIGPTSGQNCIYINTDNITYDCQGYSINGYDRSNINVGIAINGQNNSVLNCNISNFNIAVHLTNSNFTSVINNALNSNNNGIYLDGSNNNNLFENNSVDYDFVGVNIQATSSNNNFSRTHACYEGNVGFYDVSEGSNTYSNSTYDLSYSSSPVDFGQVAACPFFQGRCQQYLNESKALTSDITNCSWFALRTSADNVTINCQNHVLSGQSRSSYYGIIVLYNNTNVFNCNISTFDSGIKSETYTENLTMANDSITDTNYGAYLRGLYSNLSYSNLFSNSYGSYCQNAYNFSISNTNMSDNSNYGLYLQDSDNGTVLHNRFINNVYGFYLTNANNNQIGFNYVENSGTSNFDNSGSSCPFLFTWNGTGYDFITDVSGSGILGISRGNGNYRKPVLGDYSKIASDKLTAENGSYYMQLSEEYDEMSYFDNLKLWAVDHSPDVDIYPGLARPNTGQLYTVSKSPRTPRSCIDTHGNDCLSNITSVDSSYASGNGSETYTFVVDLGDLSNASNIKLLVDGYSGFGNTIKTSIAVKNSTGDWVYVYNGSQQMGFFAGFERMHVINMTNRFLSSNYSVRFAVDSAHWNYIAVDTSPDENYTVTTIDPDSADLHHRGYSDTVGDLAVPVYSRFSDSAPYTSPSGNFTKYGDVLPLLLAVDDKYVIMHHGDEISVTFPELSPVSNMSRDYILYTWDYFKRYKEINGSTVDPLPFRSMSNYPYPVNESYPTDLDHQNYLSTWNTRHYDGSEVTSGGGGLPNSYNNVVFNNTINGGPSSVGLLLNAETGTQLIHNLIYNVQYGIELTVSSTQILIVNNTIFNVSNYALYTTGSSGNTFLVNNITSDYWVYDDSTNDYNDSSVGNIYYFGNGTAASWILNISSSTNGSWADQGSDLPFGNSILGGSLWSANGNDWHPFLLSYHPRSSTTSSGSHHETPRLSMSLEMQCTNNTITTSTDSVSINVIDDSSGASIFSGTTDSSGHTLFSACGLHAHIYASKDGYAPTDSVYTLNDCTCAGPVVTNDTTTSTPVPPVVPPTPTPSVPTPAPVVPEPPVVIPTVNASPDTNASTFVPTFEGPDSGNLGNSVVLQVGDCPDCQVRIISPDGSTVVLTPDSSGAVRLNLNLAGRYNAALLRNGQVVSTLSVNSIGSSAPQPPSSPSFDLTLCLGAGVAVLVIGGAIYFVKRRRGGRGNK